MDPEGKIICSPINGLANRFRAMHSAYNLSRQLNRKFEIKWCPEPKTNCLFEDIFEYNDFFTNSNFNFNFKEIRKLGVESKIRTLQSKDFIYFQLGSENENIDLIRSSDVQNIIIINGGYMPGTHSENKSEEADFYSKFEVNSHIQDELFKFWMTYENKNVLGLHVRLTDNMRPHGNLNISYKNYRSNKKLFAKNVCKKIIDYIKNKDFDFLFLCSDSKDVYDFFKENFNKKLFYYKNIQSERGTKEGIIDAYIDWHLLGKCESIICSPGSTFGPCAAARKSKPFEILKDMFDFGQDTLKIKIRNKETTLKL